MIRAVTDIDLTNPGLLELGEQFFAEAQLPGRFVREKWVASWSMLFGLNIGAMWVAQLETKEIVGSLGMVIRPDICDGDPVVQEMHWFSKPGFRSGFNAIRLFECGETWARNMGAKRLAMGCVIGPHAESIRKFYLSRGFRPVDVSYIKTL